MYLYLRWANWMDTLPCLLSQEYNSITQWHLKLFPETESAHMTCRRWTVQNIMSRATTAQKRTTFIKAENANLETRLGQSENTILQDLKLNWVFQGKIKSFEYPEDKRNSVGPPTSYVENGQNILVLVALLICHFLSLVLLRQTAIFLQSHATKLMIICFCRHARELMFSFLSLCWFLTTYRNVSHVSIEQE